MPTESFKIGVEKMQQTAILKVNGAFVDFHAKDIVEIVNDLLSKDFINFILNLIS